jgi:Protein of unknown function (DUF3209)
MEMVMACRELAALRLGLMRTIGIEDESERQHELAELGEYATGHGPLQSMVNATTLEGLKRDYDAAISSLEEKISSVDPKDTKLGYYRTLLVTTKKVEFDLSNQLESLRRFYRDLDQIHDFIHEIYPAE